MHHQQILQRRLPVTVVVPVLNEERNLPACLASVAWAEEVFVVDSGSVDKTASIARSFGATVVQFHFQPGGPRKKNWSLDALPIGQEWVLFLDADERITDELQAEIRRAFDEGPPVDGYYLNRLQIFLGRALRHGGNFPSWNLRLFRRSLGRYERLGTEDLQTAGDVEVHEHVLFAGKIGYLKSPMLHEDFKDLYHFIERHNRYSTWDAKMRSNLAKGAAPASIRADWLGSPVERKRRWKTLWIRLPFKPLARFLYMYVLRAGFLDGRAGFIYACLKAIQEFHIGAKQYEESLRHPASVRSAPAAPAVHPTVVGTFD